MRRLTIVKRADWWQNALIILALATVTLVVTVMSSGTAEAEKVADIAAGHGVSVALTDDGRIWTWGYEWHGVLGRKLSFDDPITDQSTPKPISITDVKAIDAGYAHILALKEDGTVWAWGYNNYGQLGNGVTTDSQGPVQVKGLDHVKAIDAGLLYSMALKEDGTVWTWGYNNYGQLGSGQFTRFESTPVQVEGLANIVRIYAGYNHNVAIDGSGNAWTWGSNDCGELGDGTNVSRCSPVRLNVAGGIRDIAPGSSYTIMLDNEGTVRAWGENYGGWLGDGTTVSTMSPVAVKGVDQATSVATGEGISFATLDDSSIMAWGLNSIGLIGNGIRDQKVYQPGRAGNMKGITQFEVTSTHVLGLKEDGSLWGWGDNQFGEMGTGKIDDKTYTPRQITLSDIPVQPAPGEITTPTANATGDVETTPVNGSRYLLMGVIVLLCLIGAAGGVIWFSKR